MKLDYYERAEEILQLAETHTALINEASDHELKAVHHAHLERLHEEMRELWTEAMRDEGLIEPRRKTLIDHVKHIFKGWLS